MTPLFRDDNGEKSSTNESVWRPLAARSDADSRRWPALVRRLRERLGVSQGALAERLGVTQASVSRWESGTDQPSLRLRRTMRDMLNASDTSRLEQQLRARLRYAPAPMSVVGPGARFLDFSRSFAAETTTDPGCLRGQLVYGHFGDAVDATTECWERSGIFTGNIVFTLTVLALQLDGSDPVYLQNFDTPYVFEDRVISVCETRRVSRAVFEQHMHEYGRPVFCLSYDEMVD
ncbi:MAG: helix-turn-helix domain-containing protein [Pseudomonadota bacterium]